MSQERTYKKIHMIGMFKTFTSCVFFSIRWKGLNLHLSSCIASSSLRITLSHPSNVCKKCLQISKLVCKLSKNDLIIYAIIAHINDYVEGL